MGGYSQKALVSDYFKFDEKYNLVGDYGLNVTNVYTAYYIYKLTLQPVTLSVELTEEELINFINTYVKTFNAYPNVEILGYGKVENMVIKGNILNISTKVYEYKLRDSKDHLFPVYFDGNNTCVLNSENKLLKDLELFRKYASVRLNFFDEDENTVKDLLTEFLNNV